MIDWLKQKALELYSELEWRMYVATVVGRFGLRSAIGTRTVVTLPRTVPTVLLENQSRDRALLGYVGIEAPGLAALRLAASPNAGPSSTAIFVVSAFPPDPQNPGASFLTAIPAQQTFVLRPSEQLYGTNLLPAPLQLRITQEYF
jgi:hypothetical protein